MISSLAIFISYRRTDAGGHAGRLYDRLSHWFDKGVVFYDLDGIDMGDSFPAAIEAALDGAAVVLVLQDQDDLAGALELEKSALATRRRVLGEAHPDTLTSMNNLAYTLGRMNEHLPAAQLMCGVANTSPTRSRRTITSHP